MVINLMVDINKKISKNRFLGDILMKTHSEK